MLLRIGSYKDAKVLAEKWLNDWKFLLGEGHPSIIKFYGVIGEAELMLGMDLEASLKAL